MERWLPPTTELPACPDVCGQDGSRCEYAWIGPVVVTSHDDDGVTVGRLRVERQTPHSDGTLRTTTIPPNGLMRGSPVAYTADGWFVGVPVAVYNAEADGSASW